MVTKFISKQKDSILLDQLSIVPNSVSCKFVDSSFYKMDYVNAILIWQKKPIQDSILITYRTFPYKLNNSVQLYNFDSIKNNFLVTPYSPRNNNIDNKLFDFGNIEYTGSFGRGISFGNAQDAVLNSNLNLQLNGMLADSIEIAASLSDQNLPIQPDGSTTQLNEIDKIFIQFKKRNWNLNIGDIDLRQNNLYYLNFYKRLQGLSFETTNRIYKNTSNNLIVSGALARGKFNSNTFQGIEGNQGPYRLQGANNEFFFIVLGGTERVYIDGEVMQRGEDQDYIINYNTAEITFTPKRLITKDKRIRIEFEYSDRNYVNSQLFASNEINVNNKVRFRIAAYSNIDAKNSPINQTLNPFQKAFLGTIGDSTQNAFYPSVENDTLTPGKILYKSYDTIVNSIVQRIYVYSTDPDSAKYSLSFTEVGQGKGNYRVLLNGANGKVFIWVKPIGNIKQGSYEPVQYLVAPKKQQIFSFNTNYIINDKSNLNVELALSNNDVNTFSSLQKGNDHGLAGKIQFSNNATYFKNIKVKTDIGYEMNNANFRTIERLRTPEFNRDWNLPIFTPFYQEQLGSAAIQFITTKNNQVKILFNNFFKDNGYKGFRQTITTVHNIKGWQLNTNTSYTDTKDSFQNGLFFRPTVDLFKTIPKWKNYKVGINYFLEENQLLNKVGDSLNPLSIGFDAIKLYVQSNETKQNKWGLSYTSRHNRIPIGKSLNLSDKAQDVDGTLSLTENPKHKLYLKATYRKLDVNLPTRVTYKSDQTLLGRIEYNINEWKGLLNGGVLYETGSGQEQRRDFAFLQVPTGQGEYYWIDYNNDGVQQLNEFEFAIYPDQKKFIKIFVPTNQFVKANFNTFNYSFALNPRAVMRNANYKGIKNIMQRSFLQSSLQINKKEQSKNLINANPFKTNVLDTSLIILNKIFANSFSFNKFSTIWGIDINQDFRVNKALLTYGYESRDVKSYTSKARLNIKNKFLLETILKDVSNRLTTPAFNNRNFEIKQNSIENRISYTYNTKFRIQASNIVEKKKNSVLYGGEIANTNSISLDAKYNALQSASINGKFTFTNINYTGTPNTTVAFIMLDALVPGKNYLWNIDLVKTLKNNLEISFRYEGRKTGIAQTIHIGSATMRATFY